MIIAQIISWIAAFTLWVLIPLVFVFLNEFLGLPKFEFWEFRLVSYLLFIVGVSVALFSTLEFKYFGRGTPVPIRPPEKLVIRGLYKYTRNPIYIAMLLIHLGWFVLLGHAFLLALLFISFISVNIYVVFVEEPALIKRFGKKYINYTKKVPRWLFR